MEDYPKFDAEYQDKIITKVEGNGPDFTITCDDGWSLGCGGDCPVVPEVGQPARFYGRGIGHTVRGLFINGVKVFYRTLAEDKEHQEISLYGSDAADWLARWDKGESVWSIEMGGLGPAYEQCIQIVAAEAVRWYLANKITPGNLQSQSAMTSIRERRDNDLFASPVLQKLGLSGAQHGAAMTIAGRLCAFGPRAVFTDPAIKNRTIQVSKRFPDPYANV